MVNPYAPPASAPAAVPHRPLPEGMRRFRLVREPYLALVRKVVVRRYVVAGVLYGVVLACLAVLGFAVTVTGAILAVAWVGGLAVTWLRSRAMAERQMAMFEIVMSPRVLRRAMPTFGVAEMLRPEVTRIVETPRALVLMSTTPRRTLSIVRAIDGYDALRAHVATWGNIETMRGWAAFAFSWGQLRHMRPREAIHGTALASDPTLLDELTTVRALSADAGAGFGPVFNLRRRLLWMLVLWVLLVGMFLAIWQLLQPA